MVLRILAAALVLASAHVTTANSSGLDDAKRGLAELVRGNFELAVAYTTRAIESGDLEREALAITYYNRAEGHLRLHHDEVALEDFESAYRAWPEHPVTRQKMIELGLLGHKQDD